MGMVQYDPLDFIAITGGTVATNFCADGYELAGEENMSGGQTVVKSWATVHMQVYCKANNIEAIIWPVTGILLSS